MTSNRLRWFAISIFLLSSTLNYLDRSLLGALAPTLKSEFHLSNSEYGWIVSVFSIVYAFMAPVGGLFIDRVGLNLGSSVAVIVWSCASVATGLVHSFRGLLGCRIVLGLSEAAGIPGFGKANAMYLESRELALGTAINQVGISIGGIAAPLISAWLAPRYGWRSPFVLCGMLGFVWVPLWLLTSKRFPARELTGRELAKDRSQVPVREIAGDLRLWMLGAATIFIMMLYTLWTNWTTIYFVDEWHLTLEQANAKFAWIPQVFATLGGFFGGWLAFRAIRAGKAVASARLRVCWWSAVICLISTASIPLANTSWLAAASVSMSFFWCVCISTNLYAFPIDLFGAERAAFAVSVLTGSYGLMQAFLSPHIGSVVDRFGFRAICLAMAGAPLVGVWILQRAAR